MTNPVPRALPFVVSTGQAKPDPELRKLIRSHVMVGKNRGRTLPPRRRKPMAPQDDSTSPAESSSSGSSSSNSLAPTTPPRKFGSELSTIRFAGAVDPATVEVVLQFSSISKKVLFPLETCIFFKRRAEDWIAPLAFDPVYLHSMIFTSQYYFDAIMTRKLSHVTKKALPHLLETVRLLRERFDHQDNKVQLSDTTAVAVMGLAGHAYLSGDDLSAGHHMEGLGRIVRLRGGIENFRDNTKLLVEILRCDIGIAIHNGSAPVFFSNQLSLEHFTPYPELQLLLESREPTKTGARRNILLPLDDMNEELGRAWTTMLDFCSLINLAVGSGQTISVEVYMDTMVSVMYRLINLKFEAGSGHDTIRLGLLAFSCSVFLQWHHLGMSYHRVAFAFRSCLVKLESIQLPTQVGLWLIMVGASLTFDTTDDWWLQPLLRSHLSLCEVDSWSKLQSLLRSFMWIGLIHDKPAKIKFDNLNSPRPGRAGILF